MRTFFVQKREELKQNGGKQQNEAGWWCGIIGNFAIETAYHYPATGRNLFDICQKWPDGSYIDLVGISDY